MSDRMIAHYNATWFGESWPAVPVMTGYQAPPLARDWATAPYSTTAPSQRFIVSSSLPTALLVSFARRRRR